MGKVYRFQLLGYPGTISRSVDDVVVPMANADTKDIAFGQPVFLNEAGNGVVGISESSTADRFVGFAVRSGAKTPPVYDDPDGNGANSQAVYHKGEMMDVLTRGSIVIGCAGSNPKPGMPVYLLKEYGTASPVAVDQALAVPGIYFRSGRDPEGRVEVVITERHIQ